MPNRNDVNIKKCQIEMIQTLKNVNNNDANINIKCHIKINDANINIKC